MWWSADLMFCGYLFYVATFSAWPVGAAARLTAVITVWGTSPSKVSCAGAGIKLVRAACKGRITTF